MLAAAHDMGADNVRTRRGGVDSLQQALRGAVSESPAARAASRDVLVIGAGGHLGSALLAELLGGGWGRVHALVGEPLASALRGFVPVLPEQLAGGLQVDTAFIVFERERYSLGRDDAFVRPEPAALLPIAQALAQLSVRRVLVLVPHAPAFLPGALRGGFASADEVAVAGLGFEQLVFLRPARSGGDDPSLRGLQRFARWWLSQLAWMVPRQQQAVRTVRLAAVVAQLARLLHGAHPATRVLPPEVLWRAAQPDAAQPVLREWLGLADADASG